METNVKQLKLERERKTEINILRGQGVGFLRGQGGVMLGLG